MPEHLRCPVCARWCEYHHGRRIWLHVHSGAYLCGHQRRPVAEVST